MTSVSFPCGDIQKKSFDDIKKIDEKENGPMRDTVNDKRQR